MSIIKDGSGTGKTLRINTENRASTDSVTRTIGQHINEIYQKHFVAHFEAIDPTGADDYFFYMKNTGTKNIHITKMRFLSTVAGTVEVRHVSGTASSGTAVTPVNLFLGNSNAPTATIETDPDFTGLTNEGTIEGIRLDTVNKDFTEEVPEHIIIPPGQAVALLWDAATGAITGGIEFYEDQGVN
jgi:archaellum component FlaG (FlaF/FlaG flagellin family)